MSQSASVPAGVHKLKRCKQAVTISGLGYATALISKSVKESCSYTDMMLAGARDQHAFQRGKELVTKIFSTPPDAATYRELLNHLVSTIGLNETGDKKESHGLTNPEHHATNAHSENDFVNHFADANVVHMRECEASMVKEYFFNGVRAELDILKTQGYDNYVQGKTNSILIIFTNSLIGPSHYKELLLPVQAYRECMPGR